MSPIGPISPATAPQPLAGTDASGPDAQKAELTRLRRATADFEGIFIAHLLKTMQGTIPKDEDGLFKGGDVLQDVGWEKVAESMAHRGGLGLADLLFISLKGKVTAASDAPSQESNPAPIPLQQPDQSRNLSTQTPGLPLDASSRTSDKGNEGS